ncbi:YcaO-related McrA-glycine thioamidation protein [Methanocaldococcus sp.]
MKVKFKLYYKTKNPEETLKDIEEALKKINTVEIKNIAHLDKLRIPVYYLKRKVSNEIYAYHYGKGAIDIQAKVSACMEAIERYSAKYDKNLVKDPENPIDIESLILPPYSSRRVKEWVEGFDIINNETIDVPADAVFYPLAEINLFRGHTNGLASGNCLEEAILHGTFEVIERDAWSLADLAKKIPKEIDKDSIDNSIILNLLERFESAGVNIILKDLTTEFNIPVVAAVSDEPDPLMLCIGVGCHINPEIAIIRALTEVAQSRASQLHKKRRDAKIRERFIKKLNYERIKRINKKWFESEEKVDLKDLPNYASYNLKKDLNFIKNNLSEHGFDKLIYVNLNKVGVDCVRVIIPNLEVYTMDRDRLSKRALERVKTIYS